MSDIGDLSRINSNNAEDFLKFVLYNGHQFLHEVTVQLSSFMKNSFLKTLFDKSSQSINKTQLLAGMFGECADLNNFFQQAKIVRCFCHLRLYSIWWTGGMGDDTESECPSTSSSNTKITSKPVLETPPILPDMKMTLVDQTVISETFRKKDK
ncbi:hypothetical protein RhiirB3_455703 [Rhizophagus irregularis]|nr:hypothetical protein RhiirB3_455703 [Rhizophagus irregularis]